MDKHTPKKQKWPKPIKYVSAERDFGYVYILHYPKELNGRYKIGRTRNLKNRMIAHRQHYGNDIRVAYAVLVPHHKRVENGLHKMLTDFHLSNSVHGGNEWFYLGGEVFESVKSLLRSIACRYSDYQRHIYLEMNNTDWITVSRNLTPEIEAEIQSL